MADPPEQLDIRRGDAAAPLTPLLHQTVVAVLGYGNQGAVHALNLRDSGVNVIIGQRPGDSFDRAVAAGFDTRPTADATSAADLVIVALPDEKQRPLFDREILPALRRGSTIGFIHGFAIHYQQIKPPDHCGVVLVAPKGPGPTLRARYERGLGIPCLFAVHQETADNDAQALGLAWANGIGCARAGIITTTFKDETETDLFGEQAVLCGGMTHLILASFEMLVEAGYPPELAYIECCHEVKQVADLVYEHGLAGMMQRISNTAEFGAYAAGPRIVTPDTRAHMRDLLERIRDGSFAAALIADEQHDGQRRIADRAALAAHPIEQAGDVVRPLMTAVDPSAP